MFYELRERHPTSSVHVEVISVLNELLIYIVGLHAIGSVATRQQLHEVMLELRGEVCNVLPGVFADNEHLTKMRF